MLIFFCFWFLFYVSTVFNLSHRRSEYIFFGEGEVLNPVYYGWINYTKFVWFKICCFLSTNFPSFGYIFFYAMGLCKQIKHIQCYTKPEWLLTNGCLKQCSFRMKWADTISQFNLKSFDNPRSITKQACYTKKIK